MKQLAEDGIITKSDSPLNSPFLMVPKRAGPDGRRKRRMVMNFRKLNEKTIGDAHPLPDIRSARAIQILYMFGYEDGLTPDRARTWRGTKDRVQY